jgi:flagellar biogenesis protein FliO
MLDGVAQADTDATESYPMKTMLKRYALIPGVAALLILGPLSMQGGSGAAGGKPVSPTPASSPDQDSQRPKRAALVPKSPDLLQMFSALAGVLLLGAGGLYALRRLRGGSSSSNGTALVTLRQTLRLSAGHAVYVVEFDDRILLLGKHERGLALLASGSSPERTDEAEVSARAPVPAVEPGDDGAVPRDLVIPRPEASAPRVLLRPPGTPKAPSGRALGDFRALLQKVGRA